ncbi:MAG: hypothetical protein OEY64_03325 [Nitrospinota bacterium]|nr:hypothetical protein [Nitrospinota bacterium]
MSKWESETTELESKAQLKRHRAHKIEELTFDNELSPWCDADKVKQAVLFAEADAEYEQRKANLKTAILELSASERSIYFTEIGVPTDTDVNVWLAPSPVVV